MKLTKDLQTAFLQVAKDSDVVWAEPDYVGTITNSAVSYLTLASPSPRIVFRSSNPANWNDVTSDLKAKLVPYRGVKCHQGFSESLEEVLPYILQRIKETNPQEIILEGLSKGASLAILAHYVLQQLYPSLRIRTYALEPARVFSWESAHLVDRIYAGSIFWTRNECDIITHLPFVDEGYDHVGNKVQLGNRFAWWRAFSGKNWSHLLPNVVKNLQDL